MDKTEKIRYAVRVFHDTIDGYIQTMKDIYDVDVELSYRASMRSNDVNVVFTSHDFDKYKNKM